MQMHTGNQKYDVSLAKEFQEHMIKKHRKDGVIDQGKSKTFHGNKIDRIIILVHIPNLMAQGGWVSILICVLIQN